MNAIQGFFYILALVLLVLATLGVGARHFSLVAGGLAAWLVAAVFVPWLGG